MAIDQTKLKATKYPGVYRMPDGRLLARVTIRNGAKTTQRKQVLPVGSTEAEAVQATLDLREAAKNPPQTPMPLPPTINQTFEAYAASWLAIREQRVSPSTAQTYEAALHRFIVPRLGHLACRDVTRQALESWVVWAQAQVQSSSKPYTQDTMRQWWRVLVTVIADMTADLDLPDPTRRVRAPERPELSPVREQHTLTADDVGKLLDACRVKFPTRLAEVATLALTGARAGEVYALKWDCVDFATGRIIIRRALSRGALLERTKTKAQRVVPMHGELADILMAHRQYQVAQQVPGVELGMVFLSATGAIREPQSAKKMWAVLVKQAGLEQRVSPQVLRRSLNTLLLSVGVDRITLRSIMGHTSEAMTARYAGIGDDAKTDAINKIRPALALVPNG